MKRRKNGKNRKSKIQNPTLERSATLEQGLNEGMATCGLHYCRLKVFYQGRIGNSGLPVVTGIPIVIGVLDARAYCEYIYWERRMFMESYLQEEFGSGAFEVALYDENNCELGRYRYRIGGAPDYIHCKASDHEDSESGNPLVELFRLFYKRHLEEDDYFLEEDDY